MVDAEKEKEAWAIALIAGVLGAITALTCCVAPVVLVGLGFGAATSMAIMERFHAPSIVSGAILLLLLSLYFIKRKAGICNRRTVQSSWRPIVAAALIMAASVFVLNNFVVEPIASAVYGHLEVRQEPFGNLPEMMTAHHMEAMLPEAKPENLGQKRIEMQLEGIYCGSCGPAIEYDIKNIKGVLSTGRNRDMISVEYNSNITSKEIILSTIHSPYSATVLSEKCMASAYGAQRAYTDC